MTWYIPTNKKILEKVETTFLKVGTYLFTVLTVKSDTLEVEIAKTTANSWESLARYVLET